MITSRTGNTLAEIEVLSNRTIYSDGNHNAWTDLVEFQGRWYLAFRSGWWHNAPAHRSVYMRSTDLSGEKWEQPRGFYPLDAQGTLAVGVGKFFVWQDSLWYVVHPQVDTGWRPMVAHSPDGLMWTAFEPILENDLFVWHVRACDGWLYATVADNSYTSRRVTRLMRSRDAMTWEEIARWNGHQIGIAFDSMGRVFCAERTQDGKYPADHPLHALDGQHQNMDSLRWSEPPYREWHSEKTGFIMHSSVFCFAGDKLVVAGVEYLHKESRQTTVRVFDGGKFSPPVVLYDHGDCGYPGMRLVPNKNDEVLIAYYGGAHKLHRVHYSEEIDGVKYFGWKTEKGYSFLQKCDIHLARVRIG